VIGWSTISPELDTKTCAMITPVIAISTDKLARPAAPASDGTGQVG
jgi:hypothetical protein